MELKSISSSRESIFINKNDIAKATASVVQFHKYQPFRVVSIIYGISPVIIKNNRLVFSVTLLLYGFIIVWGAAVTRIWIEVAHKKLAGVNAVFESVVYFKNIILPLSCLLCSLCLLFHAKKIINLINDAISLIVQIKQQYLQRTYNSQIAVITITYASMIITNCLYHFYRSKRFRGLEILERALDIHLNLTIWFFELHFIFYLDLLTKLMKVVHKGLLTVASPHSVLLLPSYNLELVRIFNMYEQVIDLADQLCTCFGLALGMSTLLVSLQCVAFAYFQVSLPKSMLGIVLIIWLFVDLFQEWFCLRSAEIFSAEVEKTSQVVFNVMQNVQHKQLQDQLQQFSIYIIQKKPKLTICGLVPLNYTLLLTLGGAVMSYMIILVQFSNASICAQTPNTTFDESFLVTTNAFESMQ